MKLKLSDQHGVNPTISVCFFCEKDKGVALLGKLKGDVKAPKRVLMDYQPCDECRKKMSVGTTVIEVVTTDNGLPPIKEGVWPTGRWVVLKKAAAFQIFKSLNPICLLNESVFQIMTKDVVE